MVMAIAVFTYIFALPPVKISFQKHNAPLTLICFNTHSSTVTQTACSLVKWFPYTMTSILSAAQSAILNEASK